MIDENGELYGTTTHGVALKRVRAVFEGSPAGSESVISNFKGLADGANPTAALIDVGGEFYRTTQVGDGGASACPPAAR